MSLQKICSLFLMLFILLGLSSCSTNESIDDWTSQTYEKQSDVPNE